MNEMKMTTDEYIAILDQIYPGDNARWGETTDREDGLVIKEILGIRVLCIFHSNTFHFDSAADMAMFQLKFA